MYIYAYYVRACARCGVALSRLRTIIMSAGTADIDRRHLHLYINSYPQHITFRSINPYCNVKSNAQCISYIVATHTHTPLVLCLLTHARGRAWYRKPTTPQLQLQARTRLSVLILPEIAPPPSVGPGLTRNSHQSEIALAWWAPH